MRRQTIAKVAAGIGGVSAVVLLVGIVAGHARHQGELRNRQPSSAGAMARSHFVQSGQRSYRWSLNNVVFQGAQALGAARETTYQGQLNIRMMPESGGRTKMAVQLSELHVRLMGAENAEMARVFSAPFMVEIDPRGRLGESRFSPELGPGDRSVLDTAIRSLEIVLPESQDTTWEVTEMDSTGEFLAAYHRLPESGDITRVKRKYLKTKQPGLDVRVVSSSLRASFDNAGPWLARAEGHEILELLAQGRALASIDAHFSLEALPSGSPVAMPLGGDALEWSRLVVKDAPSSGPDSVWSEAEHQRQRTRFRQAGTTLDELVAGVNSHSLQDAGFAHQFASFLRAFPEQASGLKTKIAGVKPDKATLLLNILQMAGTPQAQATLADVMEDTSTSRGVRLLALTAIAGVRQPTSALVDRVDSQCLQMRARKDHSDLASSTILSLGSLADNAPKEIRSKVTGQLTAWLEAASTAEDQRLILAALGNARAQLPAEKLEPYLKSDSAQVRAAAATFVGAGRDVRTAERLGQLLQGEDAATVWSSALEALLVSPPSEAANTAIVRAFSAGAESRPDIRAQMATYLGRNSRQFPDNRKILEQELRGEANRQVIVAILNSLAK
jgi:hypothetical protein